MSQQHLADNRSVFKEWDRHSEEDTHAVPTCWMPLLVQENYFLSFELTFLSSTALVATVIELPAIASAPISGLSSSPRG